MNEPVGTTTFDAIHQAILGAMQVHFGDSIGLYGDIDEVQGPDGSLRSVDSSALLLEIEGFDAVEQDLESEQLGRLGIACDMAIHVLLTGRTRHPLRVLPGLAAHVIALVYPPIPPDSDIPVRGNLWGLGMAAELPGPPSAAPSDYMAGATGRYSYKVAWTQVFYVDHDVIPEWPNV